LRLSIDSVGRPAALNSSPTHAAGPLLEVTDLSVRFDTPEGSARAVDGVSFSLHPGEILSLVGESGCGKSVTALSVLGLIPSPPGAVDGGSIRFRGTELLKADAESLRRIRGREISMIFQEPMTSLNPVLTIGRQVAEPLMIHEGYGKKRAREAAAKWLSYVKIPAAESRLDDYPYQLSGGMRQRVMIAMAMICRPRLMIADEPTTALDVTIQAQILSLMSRLRAEFETALLLITHDLGVVAQTARRVIVMYAGQVVETAGVEDLFAAPFHPYTRGLLRSIPKIRTKVRSRLVEIPGTVPAITESITGCKFAGRCRHAFELCNQQAPKLVKINADAESGRLARCHLVEHPKRRKPDA
jgi:oligopeptide/dipeptide ABC transporter ATP-binding protein